ncbi:toxin-antitoxin system YwqK family antitoxin [bacterium]|nr:toxin-antitoxin system YwqK family antitoxin [bacterium]
MKFLLITLTYFVCNIAYSQDLQLKNVVDIPIDTEKYDVKNKSNKKTKQNLIYVYLKGTDKYVAKIIESDYEQYLKRGTPNYTHTVTYNTYSFDSTFNVYDQYNRIYSIYNYVNNVATKNIVYYTYYDTDTNILSIENYYGRKLEGKVLSFYKSGQLKKESYLINGKLEGACISYFENGNIEKQHYHQKDKQNGLYLKYYENGFLERKGYLKNDKGVGEWIYYYPNGKIKEKGFEVKNKRNGWWFFYNNLGEFTHPKYYKNGKIKDVPKELGINLQKSSSAGCSNSRMFPSGFLLAAQVQPIPPVLSP